MIFYSSRLCFCRLWYRWWILCTAVGCSWSIRDSSLRSYRLRRLVASAIFCWSVRAEKCSILGTLSCMLARTVLYTTFWRESFEYNSSELGIWEQTGSWSILKWYHIMIYFPESQRFPSSRYSKSHNPFPEDNSTNNKTHKTISLESLPKTIDNAISYSAISYYSLIVHWSCW